MPAAVLVNGEKLANVGSWDVETEIFVRAPDIEIKAREFVGKYFPDAEEPIISERSTRTGQETVVWHKQGRRYMAQLPKD